jgi:hypothetical protein
MVCRFLRLALGYSFEKHLSRDGRQKHFELEKLTNDGSAAVLKYVK